MRNKQEQCYRRHRRIRAKVIGTKERPRLSVFRSNQHICVQLIDDEKGKTLVSVSDLKVKKKKGLTKTEIAKEVGKSIAKKALEKRIEKIVFDRGGYKYHGRVKAVAEGAREGGLEF
jgi:large subunit ribosomal protein L18